MVIVGGQVICWSRTTVRGTGVYTSEDIFRYRSAPKAKLQTRLENSSRSPMFPAVSSMGGATLQECLATRLSSTVEVENTLCHTRHTASGSRLRQGRECASVGQVNARCLSFVSSYAISSLTGKWYTKILHTLTSLNFFNNQGSPSYWPIQEFHVHHRTQWRWKV